MIVARWSEFAAAMVTVGMFAMLRWVVRGSVGFIAGCGHPRGAG